jgi:hypothetical protein
VQQQRQGWEDGRRGTEPAGLAGSVFRVVLDVEGFPFTFGRPARGRPRRRNGIVGSRQFGFFIGLGGDFSHDILLGGKNHGGSSG